MDVQLLLVGFGAGCVAAAAAIALARAREQVDEGWVVTCLAVALVAVLAAAEQVPVGAVAVAAGSAVVAGLGVRLVRAAGLRVWSTDVLAGSLVATAVGFAVLPDTEGTVLFGAALVPVTLAALVRRSWWRGPAAGAATASLLTAVGMVGIDAAAGRTPSLVGAAAATAICAGAVVLVTRVLLDRPD